MLTAPDQLCDFITVKNLLLEANSTITTTAPDSSWPSQVQSSAIKKEKNTNIFSAINECGTDNWVSRYKMWTNIPCLYKNCTNTFCWMKIYELWLHGFYLILSWMPPTCCAFKWFTCTMWNHIAAFWSHKFDYHIRWLTTHHPSPPFCLTDVGQVKSQNWVNIGPGSACIVDQYILWFYLLLKTLLVDVLWPRSSRTSTDTVLNIYIYIYICMYISMYAYICFQSGTARLWLMVILVPHWCNPL